MGNVSRSEVVQIGDHMALSCACGAVNFALLRSGRIECNRCGLHQSVVWIPSGSELHDAFTLGAKAKDEEIALGGWDDKY